MLVVVVCRLLVPRRARLRARHHQVNCSSCLSVLLGVGRFCDSRLLVCLCVSFGFRAVLGHSFFASTLTFCRSVLAVFDTATSRRRTACCTSSTASCSTRCRSAECQWTDCMVVRSVDSCFSQQSCWTRMLTSSDAFAPSPCWHVIDLRLVGFVSLFPRLQHAFIFHQ